MHVDLGKLTCFLGSLYPKSYSERLKLIDSWSLNPGHVNVKQRLALPEAFPCQFAKLHKIQLCSTHVQMQKRK